ncbi:MAG TPA: class I SAM-dependent methyltransferase [Pirellulales bacterium]|nr:class I SAM-dependent methyltransferase [Pirellulales bacterium]
MTQPDRATARRLAQESLARQDAIGWFDALYIAAQDDASLIPWADMRGNPIFAKWLGQHPLAGQGKRALVIGCGLGDDAQELAALGFEVTAFDVSARAIEWCRRRFPDSGVNYRVADLLNPPAGWNESFDFVLEIYTLQVLPADLRPAATSHMASFVGRGGTLLVVARGREPAEDRGAMPWPLVKDEFEAFTLYGLETVSFEDYFDGEDPPVRRFRVEYRRPL